MNSKLPAHTLLSLLLGCILSICQSQTDKNASSAGSAAAATATTFSAVVISTGDGDTLRVQTAESVSPTTVRIGCVDAPETSQAGGDWSAGQLAQLLPVGTQIEITPLDTDRYGRTVAEIWKNGQSVNLELVRAGAALVYPDYVEQGHDPAALMSAEANARAQQLGLWSLPPQE